MTKAAVLIIGLATSVIAAQAQFFRDIYYACFFQPAASWNPNTGRPPVQTKTIEEYKAHPVGRLANGQNSKTNRAETQKKKKKTP